MSFHRKLASHTAIYGLSSIIGRILTWGLTPLYVNYFNPAEFGKVSDLYAFTFYFIILISFRMETTFFRFSKNIISFNKAFSNALFVEVSLATIFLLTTLPFVNKIAGILGYADQVNTLILVILIIVLDALGNLSMAALRYKEKAVRFAIISIVNIILTISLNIWFIAVLKKGIHYIFVANVIASATKLLLTWIFLRPVKIKVATGWIKPMLKYAAPIVVAGFAGALNETLDRNLLPRLWDETKPFLGKFYSGIELTGIYSTNYKLAIFISLFTQAFRYAAEPLFFKNIKNKDNKSNIATSYYYFLLFALTGFVAISVFKYFIASFNFFGLANFRLIPEPYWVGLRVVPILLLANIALASYITFAMWFKIVRKTKFGMYFSLIGASITLIVNVLLIPEIGFFASALATFLCYSTMALLCLIIGQKHYKIPYNYSKIIEAIIISVILVAIYELWEIKSGFSNSNFVVALAIFGTWLLFVFFRGRKG